MSFPFFKKQFTFTQPDGKEIRVVGTGNQHHAVFETPDGYTLIKDPVSGYYQYADAQQDELVPSGIPLVSRAMPLHLQKGLRDSREAVRSKVVSGEGLPPGNARWRQRRKEARSAIIRSALDKAIMPAPPQRQTVGNYTGLCLLVQFPDVQATISQAEVDAFCNQNDYSSFGNNGSVYNYFFDNSLGKLKYNNIVAPYYTAKHPRAYYTNKNVRQPIRARELILEALAFHKANGFNFTQLTADAKKYVYAVNVFYAGEVVNDWAEGLWPHSHYLGSAVELAPGKFAYDYQVTNMGSELSLGTFCHENGHMICDFPDLYDYGNQSLGVGAFCLMCAGGNIDEKNPVEVGAYLKYKAGWTGQLTNIVAGLQARADHSRNEFFILRKNAVEYFILENRCQKSRDAALPGSGLAIWHIDELGDNSNEQMTAAEHYECSLVQADGKNDLEYKVNYGDESDLFHAPGFPEYGHPAKPSKWWDGSPSALQIAGISAPGDQITFSIK